MLKSTCWEQFEAFSVEHDEVWDPREDVEERRGDLRRGGPSVCGDLRLSTRGDAPSMIACILVHYQR